MMASRIILDNITFNNNPAPFLDNLELQITFTALQPITHPLEWKIIYVGSAKNEDFDQILQEFQIDPISEQSTMKFTMECGCPNYTKIPADELICVTALIITINYKAQELIRVGYYVHNVLDDAGNEQQPSLPLQALIKNTKRTILADKPRITTFRIDWDREEKENEKSSDIKAKTDNALNSPGSGKKDQPKQEINEQQKPGTIQQKEQNLLSNVKGEVLSCQVEQKEKQFW